MTRYAALRASVRAVWHAAVCTLALALPAAAVEVPNFYETEVPVADQSAAERGRAVEAALREVLTRFTGVAPLPESGVLGNAIAQADHYYHQYGYQAGPDGELRLRVSFVPNAMLSLVRAANLPIWRTDRPLVMVWVVVDDGQSRRILGADDDQPLLDGLKARARQRGLPLRLPLMDLTDQMATEPGAIWGGLIEALEPASERYRPDMLLLGRVEERAPGTVGGAWSVRWTFHVDGDLQEFAGHHADPLELGRAAADQVADALAARYAVHQQGGGALQLVVGAIDSAADYADLLRYLGSFEFVEDLRVDSVQGDRIRLQLATGAGAPQLLELLRLDGRLLPEEPVSSFDPGGSRPGWAASGPGRFPSDPDGFASDSAGTGTLRLVWQPR